MRQHIYCICVFVSMWLKQQLPSIAQYLSDWLINHYAEGQGSEVTGRLRSPHYMPSVCLKASKLCVREWTYPYVEWTSGQNGCVLVCMSVCLWHMFRGWVTGAVCISVCVVYIVSFLQSLHPNWFGMPTKAISHRYRRHLKAFLREA